MSKRQIDVSLDKNEEVDRYDNLQDYIDFLTDILDNVPTEYKDHVVISTDSHIEDGWNGDEVYTLTEIYYSRNETDDEYYQRTNRHEIQAQRNADEKEVQERKEYERLQRLYGG